MSKFFTHLLILLLNSALVYSSTFSPTSPKLVIGVDAGTESIRVGIFDVNANASSVPIATSSSSYHTSFPQPGYAEQDPLEWWKCFGIACRDAISKMNDDDHHHRQINTGSSEREGKGERREDKYKVSDIVSICIDTTACSVVALDKDFHPLRKCLLWCDTRAALQCGEIMTKAKGDAALRRNCNGQGPLSAEWYSLTLFIIFISFLSS